MKGKKMKQLQQLQQRCDDNGDETPASTSSTTYKQDCSYKILAMVPRGLQEDVIDQIVEYHQINQQNKDDDDNKNKIVEFSILDEKVYNDYGEQAYERYVEQQQLKEKRMKEHHMKNPQHHHLKSKTNHQQKKKNVDINAWLRQPVGTIGLNPNLYVSFGYKNEQQIHQHQQQRSIISKTEDESDAKNNKTTPESPSSPSNIPWTGPGQLFGSVWLQVNCSSSSATKNNASTLTEIDSIASLRCLGATLSLMRVGSLMNKNETPEITTTITLGDITKRFTEWISTNSSYEEKYPNEFQSAFEIWKYHVQSSWKNQIPKQDYEELQQRIQNNRIKFRVSCIREMPLGSSSVSTTTAKKRRKKKKNKGSPADADATGTDGTTSTHTTTTTIPSSDFTRQDIVSSIMDTCGHLLIPGYVDDPDDKSQNEKSNLDDNYREWQVDLIHYDVEVVIVLTARMTAAIGISLQPYSYLKSKSFEGGAMPTDITPPHIGGNILSKGIVRLRPTTAHTLLHIANCQPYDIVLDPCAGIGTIPIEADKYYFRNNNRDHQRNNMIGLGGDIVLHHPQISTAASVLEEAAVADISSLSSTSSVSSSLLASWDATYMPVRTGCADIVLSDLPFGQQCLSASALNQLLPLIMRQCARVLVANTGRMVVLCGSPHAICKAIEDSCSNYWVQPCTRITPVTIGGIIAWIVRVERNGIPFHDNERIDENEEASKSSMGEKIRNRIRKVAQRRDRIAEYNKNTPKNEIKKRRLVQS